jgi:transposase-like protein
MSKKLHRIPPEVKADILKRVKEEGIPVAQAAKDHGIHEATIYNWLGKGASGAPSWSEFTRLQKQIKELLELVGELTLKLSISQKNS